MGDVITFYSYKGGVGRSMALANVAVLLARWGYKVLMVDWDLEAPGLEFYFKEYLGDLEQVAQREGVIDILDRVAEGPKQPEGIVEWRDCLVTIQFDDCPDALHLITAGKLDSDYFRKVRDLDINALYGEKDGGSAIERLRDEWMGSYDFVLVDSRTGITDIGGICTVQMPNTLVLVFTANEQSLEGVFDVSRKVVQARQKLPFDRMGLRVLPIASKFDSREEFTLSQMWLKKFSEKLNDLYTNWLSRTIEVSHFIEVTKIPYTSYFSFGEKLPVVEQGTIDPGGLGHAYESIAALIAHGLESVEQFVDNRSDFVRSATLEACRPTGGGIDDAGRAVVEGPRLPQKAPTKGTVDATAPVFVGASSRPHRKVFISSTLRDLAEHRKAVMDACLRQGMFPVMAEDLPSNDAGAAESSLKLVDDADVYLGVLGYRYGYVPTGASISITEMEYNRAVERGIPSLVFLMDADHPVRAADVETGDGAAKLAALKSRMSSEYLVGFFKSPEELRGAVIIALSRLREPEPSPFHYVSDIPAPPEAYIAHPYTLLQTGHLIGRQTELNELTEWVARSDKPVLNLVAIGGMGKSALTWHWFNKVAPFEMKSVAGRLWWSFYESDATFENCIIRALAYVTKRPREEVQKIPPPEREEQLLAVLDREPYLVVLDGLERILIAYARMDAAHLSDEGTRRADARLRETANPHGGAFLRKLSVCRAARVLISTRLYPAELEDRLTGDPLPGCQKLDLVGLTDDDALNLWRAFGVSGSRDALLPVFQSFGKHPLLIQALAGEVKRDRRANGDFERWQHAHPQFEPMVLPGVKEASAQVLEAALQGLSGGERRVLDTLAALRMAASYDILTALLVGDGKPFADERALDLAFVDLEDRGLLGWDRRANRYDLHPIVRGVVWSGADQDDKQGIYAVLQAYFELLPAVEWQRVNSLDDLTPAVELYHTLIGLGRHEDAYLVFRDRLDLATLYRLSASRLRVELLEALFPDGLSRPPRLANPRNQAHTLNALAQGYQFSGRPGAATLLFQRDNTLSEDAGDQKQLAVGLCNLADALRFAGHIRESEPAARQALGICRHRGDHFSEGIALYLLGLTLAARGAAAPSARALETALRIFAKDHQPQMEGVTSFYLAQRALWLGDAAAARQGANRAWELAHVQRFEGDFVRTARLQGEAALALGDLPFADERLHHALTRARTVDLTQEELPALTALAELHRRGGDPKAAREMLDPVWEPAERGPYPLLHADALNVLAQIERDAGNTTAAIRAATEAYEKAWCDGPPFAYHWGLEKAKAHLAALGAPEPALPPFDESKYEPMPEN